MWVSDVPYAPWRCFIERVNILGAGKFAVGITAPERKRDEAAERFTAGGSLSDDYAIAGTQQSSQGDLRFSPASIFVACA
jgi:hypothetical protein